MGYSGCELLKPISSTNQDLIYRPYLIKIQDINKEIKEIEEILECNRRIYYDRCNDGFDNKSLVENIDLLVKKLEKKRIEWCEYDKKIKEVKLMSVTNHMKDEIAYPFGININNAILIDPIEIRKYECLDTWLAIPDQFEIKCIGMYSTKNGNSRVVELYNGTDILNSEYKMSILTTDAKANAIREIIFFERAEIGNVVTDIEQYRTLRKMCGDGYITLNWENDEVPMERIYTRILDNQDLSKSSEKTISNHKLFYNKVIDPKNNKEYAHEWSFQCPIDSVPYITMLYEDKDTQVGELVEFDCFNYREGYRGSDFNARHVIIWVGVKLSLTNIKGIYV